MRATRNREGKQLHEGNKKEGGKQLHEEQQEIGRETVA